MGVVSQILWGSFGPGLRMGAWLTPRNTLLPIIIIIIIYLFVHNNAALNDNVQQLVNGTYKAP